MASGKRKFMDVLEDVAGDSSDDSDDEKPEKGDEPASSTKSQKLGLQDLKRAGFKEGPSVLHIPAQPKAAQQTEWGWSQGHAAKEQETEETREERADTRHAVTVAVEASARYTQQLVARTEAQREERKVEKESRLKKKDLSFRDKEKRKRDTGKQAGAKIYVEEEKRIAREFGVYSGFDT